MTLQDERVDANHRKPSSALHWTPANTAHVLTKSPLRGSQPQTRPRAQGGTCGPGLSRGAWVLLELSPGSVMTSAPGSQDSCRALNPRLLKEGHVSPSKGISGGILRKLLAGHWSHHARYFQDVNPSPCAHWTACKFPEALTEKLQRPWGQAW